MQWQASFVLVLRPRGLVSALLVVALAAVTACSSGGPEPSADTDLRSSQVASKATLPVAAAQDSASPASVDFAAADGRQPKAPACTEVYAEGAPAELDTTKVCDNGTEALQAEAPTVLECKDGRTLLYHDVAWGYQGEVGQPYPAGAEHIAAGRTGKVLGLAASDLSTRPPAVPRPQ